MSTQDSAIARTAVPVRGLGLAAVGMLGFSFSFPATVWALRGLNPYLIGIGRAAVAGVLALIVVAATRARRPRGDEWFSLGLVGVGVVFGFPVLSSLALDHGASSSHSAVVIGLLPVTTAIMAVMRAGERPSLGFWLAGAAGAACLAGYTLRQGAGRFAAADLLLFGALAAGALGYAEGGMLARRMPGWSVVSWALIMALPVSAPLTIGLGVASPPHWSGHAVAGMAYVSGVSMFLGFFAWYAGLAKAGVARASQVQLVMPLLTLVWSWLILGEHADASTLVAAVAVILCVVATQRTRVRRTDPPAHEKLPDVTSTRMIGADMSQRR